VTGGRIIAHDANESPRTAEYLFKSNLAVLWPFYPRITIHNGKLFLIKCKVLVQKQLGPSVAALPVNHHSQREVTPWQVQIGKLFLKCEKWMGGIAKSDFRQKSDFWILHPPRREPRAIPRLCSRNDNRLRNSPRNSFRNNNYRNSSCRDRPPVGVGRRGPLS